MAAKHRPPCVAGEHCGEPAHCPPVERKPRSRKPRTTQSAPVDPKAAALSIATEIAKKRQSDGDR